jgi:hypothetical protein
MRRDRSVEAFAVPAHDRSGLVGLEGLDDIGSVHPLEPSWSPVERLDLGNDRSRPPILCREPRQSARDDRHPKQLFDNAERRGDKRLDLGRLVGRRQLVQSAVARDKDVPAADATDESDDMPARSRYRLGHDGTRLSAFRYSCGTPFRAYHRSISFRSSSESAGDPGSMTVTVAG